MEVRPGYKQTEVGVIPEEWDVSDFRERLRNWWPRAWHISEASKKEMFVREGKKVYGKRNAIYRDPEIGNHFITDNRYGELKRFSVNPGEFIVIASGTLAEIVDSIRCASPDVINQAALEGTDGLQSDMTPIIFYYYFGWTNSEWRIYRRTATAGQCRTSSELSEFRTIPIARPPLPEQRAIAAALSDVDALLDKLNQFIAKKRDLKQAAMQQLLTGKTRLPGFSGEWEVKRLGMHLRRLVMARRRQP